MTGFGDVKWLRLTPVELMAGEDEAETMALHLLHRKAAAFMMRFAWCLEIRGAHLGYGIGGIIGIFLIEIEPAPPCTDRLFWVIVGDVPSAHLVTDGAKSPSAALALYIGYFGEWVDAAAAGRTVRDLIPAQAPATKANAALLRIRLDFLKHKLPALGLDVGAVGDVDAERDRLGDAAGWFHPSRDT